MPPWPRRPGEEGFDHIAFLFEEVAKIERSTRSATASCWPMWRADWCSPGWRDDLAVQQLRPHPCGQAGPGDVPRLCPSQGVFPAEGGELLIETGPGSRKAPGFSSIFTKSLHIKGGGVYLPKVRGLYIIVMRGKLKELLFCFPIKAKEVCAGPAGQRDPCLWPVQRPCAVRCDGGRRVGHDTVPAPLVWAVA